MTFSQLKKKDIICIGDGKLLGRAGDLQIDTSSGQVRALIIASGACMPGIFHGEKNQAVIPWQQIACIGDDVILVSVSSCR